MVDSGGDSMDARIDTIASKLDQRFDALAEQLRVHADETRRRFELQDERIRAEGERTRRHFDIVAEQMRAERNLGLDASLAGRAEVGSLRQSNADEHVLFEKVLTDHEARLSRLEKKTGGP